jgi:predicted extracellular nuclease
MPCLLMICEQVGLKKSPTFVSQITKIDNMKKNYIFTLLMTFCLTSASFGQYSDLFISMYAEGSSNNKFIEIYNGTGSSIDLSDYMIKGSNNGGDWKAERDLALTGTLVDGEVYVISTDDADAVILTVADLNLPYESPVHYNGDDAIAIFKKNTGGTFDVLDIIGVPTEDPGSSWGVAGVSNGTQNHTLTRKNTISGPNTDWTSSAGADEASSEWVVTDVDTEWNNLGSYTGSATASVKNNAIEGFATYPNPITNNVFTITSNSTSKKEFAIFNLLGKQVLSSSFSGVKSNVDVSTISAGIYILKVTEGGKTASKKLVIR